MACRILSSDGAVFALWGAPTIADVDEVLKRVRAAERAAGHPVVYITRVPVDAPPPEPDVRQRLNEIMPAMRASCSSYHVILEGEGFLSAIKRAIVASLMQVGWPRDTFFVHATPKGVAFKVSLEARRDVEVLLNLAEQQGLLTGRAPVETRASVPEHATRV